MIVTEALRKAASELGAAGIADPRREAASLLALALEKDRIFLIAHPEYELTAEDESRFEGYLKRRAGREPLQYIRGTQEFYGLDFEVSPGVLIPRPETELLVEHAIEIPGVTGAGRFCEVGVGSGCISISILHEVPGASAIGLDISGDALATTRKNAEKHSVSHRLDLRLSDVFAELGDEKFDMIVSNPPYISRIEFDALQPEVRDFEPRDALTDGGTGLSIIEKIVSGSPKFLKSDGYLLMEIGFGEADAVAKMFDTDVWQVMEIMPNLQLIPRVVKARRR